MQFLDLEFVADQFQQYADSDPDHWNSEEGCIKFGETPVFYKRFHDHFEIEIDGITMEIPRI